MAIGGLFHFSDNCPNVSQPQKEKHILPYPFTPDFNIFTAIIIFLAMKKGSKIVLITGIVITVIYLCLPYYVRQAVIHLYPDIDDLDLFDKHVVHAPDSSRTWPKPPTTTDTE